MRTLFISAGAIGALGIILAACGGGGGGSTPSVPAQTPVVAATFNPNQLNSTVTGPSGQVTLSFKIPQRTLPTAAQKLALVKRFGQSSTNPRLRAMWNTSPSAAVRKAGQALHAYTAANRTPFASRSPQYISPAVEDFELVLTDSSNNMLSDDTGTCTSSTCTGSFSVPVGTNLNAILYLYDGYCGYLIGAGEQTGVTITLGNSTNVTITVNGLVGYFGVTSSVSSLAFGTATPSVPIGVVAYDWTDSVISSSVSAPSVLLDSNFNQITGVTIAQDASQDVTPYPSATVAPNADLTFNNTPFAYAGTGSESQVDFTVSEIPSGTAYLPVLYNGGDFGSSPGNTNQGTLTIPVTGQPTPTPAPTPAYIAWTNAGGYQTSESGAIGDGGPLYTQNGNNASIEFTSLGTSGNTFTLGLTDNYSPSTVSLSDGGGCSGIATFPSSIGYGSNVTFTETSQSGPASCTVTASDFTNNVTASVNIIFDQNSVIIERKARSSK